MKKNYSKSTLLCSACFGNFFEHYDTALFGFLSPFLAPLIFPKEDYLSALILTYAIIPIGMLARPFGALFFGYIGDHYCRKYALYLAMAGMAFVSGFISFSPTYFQAGILAPILFSLGRIAQNFLASGETMGGAIFLLENSPKEKHDFLSGLYNSTTIGGIILASIGVSVISSYEMMDWGWRLLYLLGCITAVFGIILRKDLPVIISKPTTKPELLNTFITYRKPLLLIIIASGFSYATYIMAVVLMNGFIPLISPYSKGQMLELNTFLLVIDFFALPFFGWLASKISKEKMMLYAALGVVVGAIPLSFFLSGASLMGIIAIRICLILSGVAFFAPFHAWAQGLIPPAYRYTIISFGYAVGSQLLGGPTAALSLWFFQMTGIVSSIVWYWLGLALLSTVAIGLSYRKEPELKLSHSVKHSLS